MKQILSVFSFVAVILISGCCSYQKECQSDTPFPAEVMKWNKAEKERQRQAGSELLNKLYKAIDEKSTVFNIPKGIYRFHDLQIPRQPVHIRLKKVKNLTIEGNGSWFYFDRQASAFQLSGCDNVTIRNLNIDYDPLPYCQGKVVSYDDSSRPRSFVMKLDPGYTMPELMIKNKVDWRNGLGGNARILLWDKNGLAQSDQLGMDVQHCENPVTKLSEDTYRIATWVWWGKSLKEAGFKIGTPVTLWRRAGRAIRIEVCGKVVLDNVDIYASGFVGYVGYLGDGPFIFRNCDLKIRPGTNRIISGNADGFNIRGTLKGAVIEDCSAEAIGDDCINLQGVYYKVFKQLSPTELIVARTPGNDGKNPVWHFISGNPWKDPNRPNADKLKSWAFLGKRKVLSKTAIDYTIPKGRELLKWAAANRYTPGKTYPAYKVTLDKGIKVDSNSIFWSENAIVKGSVIRNNVFHNNIARGIRLQTIDCLVENNNVSYTTGASLTLAGQPGYWGESTNCQNVVIKNNTFKDSGICGGNAAVTMTVEGNPEQAEPIKDITFENNQIINPRGSGIELSGCENIKIINNTISGLKSRPMKKKHNPNADFINPEDYGKPIVKGKGLKNIVIQDNVVK